MKTCWKCRAELSGESRFCPNCGQGVSDRRCQVCSAAIPEDSVFCPDCGKKANIDLCTACGAPATENSSLCLQCEGKEAAERAGQETLRGREEGRVGKEKARHEVESARAMAMLEQEETRPVSRASVKAGKEAEAPAGKNARQAVALPTRRRRLWYLVGGICLVLVVATGIYVLLFNPHNPGQGTPAAPVTPVTPAPMPTVVPNPTVSPTTPTPTLAPSTTSTPAPSVPLTPVVPTMAEVLARASAITSVKYDSTVNRPGTPVISMKLWEKGNKVRIETTEQATSIVVLANGDTRTVYRYTPSQNTAERMPYPSQARTALGAVNILKSSNVAASGTAVIDGKNCLIVTLGTDANVRMWLWQDYGIPLLLEETSATGKTTVEFRNLDFTDIPASSFDLPQGVRVVSGGPPAP